MQRELRDPQPIPAAANQPTSKPSPAKGERVPLCHQQRRIMWSYDIVFCNDLCNVTGFGGIHGRIGGWLVGRPGGGTQCRGVYHPAMARPPSGSPPAKPVHPSFLLVLMSLLLVLLLL